MKPSSRALPRPPASDIPTRDAPAPCCATAAHTSTAPTPRTDAASTANGSRVSPPPAHAMAPSCSAPSRSAGCTCMPCQSRCRRSRATLWRPSHTQASRRYDGPYCSPDASKLSYSAPTVPARPHAHERADAWSTTSQLLLPATAPEQCTAASTHIPSSSPLRTSNRPSRTAHSTSSPAASTTSGCTKKTPDSAPVVAAARAISR